MIWLLWGLAVLASLCERLHINLTLERNLGQCAGQHRSKDLSKSGLTTAARLMNLKPGRIGFKIARLLPVPERKKQSCNFSHQYFGATNILLGAGHQSTRI